MSKDTPPHCDTWDTTERMLATAAKRRQGTTPRSARTNVTRLEASPMAMRQHRGTQVRPSSFGDIAEQYRIGHRSAAAQV